MLGSSPSGVPVPLKGTGTGVLTMDVGISGAELLLDKPTAAADPVPSRFSESVGFPDPERPENCLLWAAPYRRWYSLLILALSKKKQPLSQKKEAGVLEPK